MATWETICNEIEVPSIVFWALNESATVPTLAELMLCKDAARTIAHLLFEHTA